MILNTLNDKIILLLLFSFPEWSQGSWADLNIIGGSADYTYAFYVEDLNGETNKKRLNDEGENGNAETAMLTRVPINDHRTRFDRNRRSLNSTYYIRKPTTPVPFDSYPYIGMTNEYGMQVDKSNILEKVLELLKLRSKRQLKSIEEVDMRILPYQEEDKIDYDPNNRGYGSHPTGPTPPPSPPPTPPNTPPRKPLPSIEKTKNVKKYLSEFHDEVSKASKNPTHLKNVLNNRKKRSNSINDDSMTSHLQTPLLLVSSLEDTIKKYNSLDEHKVQQKQEKSFRFFEHIYGDGNHDLTMMTPYQTHKQEIALMDSQNKKPIEVTHENNNVEQPWFSYQKDTFYNILAKDNKPSFVIKNMNKNRNKRSVDEIQKSDYTSEYDYDDEEAVLEQIRIAEEEKKKIFEKWWPEFQENAMIEYKNRWRLAKGIEEENYDKYPERKPVPSPIDYLQLSEKNGVPYKEAVIQWREMERTHRMWRAEVEYLVYPYRNSPDVVMNDFDMTYKDIEYDFNPQYPEGTSKDPTAYRVQTLPGGYRLTARQSRRNAWNERQLRAASKKTVISNRYKKRFITSGTKKKFLDKDNLKGSREKRSYDDEFLKHHPLSRFTWHCILSVDSDSSQTQDVGLKFLTVGGEMIHHKIPSEQSHE